MSDSSDVCATCSGVFEDDKCIIKCIMCLKYFHPYCEGILQLRGLNKKRHSWKCTNCRDPVVLDGESPVEDVPIVDQPSRKRLKHGCGDVIEVDKSLLEGLYQMISQLTRESKEMKQSIGRLCCDNQLLLTEIKVLKEKFSSDNTQTKSGSYSSAVRSNKNNKQQQNVFNFTARNSIDTRSHTSGLSAVHSVPDVNESRSSGHTPHQTPVDTSRRGDSNSPSSPIVDQSFKPVTTKKQRKMKPVIIGSKSLEPLASQVNNEISSFEGTERRHWIYVGRCKPKTSIDMVSNYVKNNWNISDVKCVNLINGDEICSFKIGVPESLIASLLVAEKWPKGVAVREFVKFPNKRRVGNADFRNGRKNPQTVDDAKIVPMESSDEQVETENFTPRLQVDQTA